MASSDGTDTSESLHKPLTKLERSAIPPPPPARPPFRFDPELLFKWPLGSSTERVPAPHTHTTPTTLDKGGDVPPGGSAGAVKGASTAVAQEDEAVNPKSTKLSRMIEGRSKDQEQGSDGPQPDQKTSLKRQGSE
ncbi:hypothetical protein JCM5296_001996 [Sporobolomyces johnsonii]